MKNTHSFIPLVIIFICSIITVLWSQKFIADKNMSYTHILISKEKSPEISEAANSDPEVDNVSQESSDSPDELSETTFLKLQNLLNPQFEENQNLKKILTHQISELRQQLNFYTESISKNTDLYSKALLLNESFPYSILLNDAKAIAEIRKGILESISTAETVKVFNTSTYNNIALSYLNDEDLSSAHTFFIKSLQENLNWYAYLGLSTVS
ncbi:MAG: hypothetical protein ABL927_12710, partial [Bdellovibrionales bacterium]